MARRDQKKKRVKTTRGKGNKIKRKKVKAPQKVTLFGQQLDEIFILKSGRAQDQSQKKVFIGSSILILLISILMSLSVGINSDDTYQNDYSELVVDFYASLGRDTSFMEYEEEAKIYYYGAFFEVIAGATTSMLGLDPNDAEYHQIRHVWNAIFGVAAMVFTGLIARYLGGWIPAILVLFFMFLSPRFLGHSLMNPKDIPFAFGYIMSVFYMIRVLDGMPKPKRQDLALLALGFGVSIGTRAGGLILVPYLLLFIALTGFIKHDKLRFFSNGKLLMNYASAVLIVIMGGMLVGILLWPYALLDPLKHPIEALNTFTKVWTSIKVLYGGEMIWSADTPWHYPVLMLLKTTPLFILLGFLFILLFLKSALRRFPVMSLSLLVFVAIFPVAYIIAKQSTLYDGIRHIIFVCPPMACLGALGWWLVHHKFSNPYVRYSLAAVLLATMVETAIFTVRNASYPYVYFNALNGGMKGALGHYELDYWGISVKQAFDWMEKEGIVSADRKDTVTIASNFSYALSRYASEYGDHIKPVYVRWRQRNDKPWDYAIFINRYVDASYLQAGSWPTDKTIHTIRANGVPLAIVEKDDPGQHGYHGAKAIARKDWNEAIKQYQEELAKYPNNELALIGLGMAYLNLNQMQMARGPLERALQIVPESQNALNFAGYYHFNTSNYEKAKELFTKAGELHNTNATAFYYLARLEQLSQNNIGALEYVQECIDANGRFKECYLLGAEIYQQMGDAARAKAYFDAAGQL